MGHFLKLSILLFAKLSDLGCLILLKKKILFLGPATFEIVMFVGFIIYSSVHLQQLPRNCLVVFLDILITGTTLRAAAKCDAIRENLPYRGTNFVGFDQTSHELCGV